MSLGYYLHCINGTRADKYPHYYSVYDRHFARFYGTSCTVLEIGIGEGGSLRLWRVLFGPDALIAGIDIEEKCRASEKEGFDVFIGSQGDKNFLEEVYGKLGEIDVVIDDGSHSARETQVSFDTLYPRMSKNGIYLIEDLHEPMHSSFVKWAKDRTDDLSAYRFGGDPAFATTTRSIHFYESIIVFERGRAAPYRPGPAGPPRGA